MGIARRDPARETAPECNLSSERQAGPGGVEGEIAKLISEREWDSLVRLFQLTRAQARVARLVCTGRSQRSIAGAMGISVNTVRMHMRGLFAHLNTHDRVGVLVRLLSARRRVEEERSAATLRT